MPNVIQNPNPVLRQKAQKVPPEEIQSETIQTIISDMKKTLADTPDGVALAAPQIGKALQIFIISGKIFSENRPTANIVYINPQITEKSKKERLVDEGCLSVRGIQGKIMRAESATVRAYNASAEIFTMHGTGLLAQIFQHETDHLKGVLFIDNAQKIYHPEKQTS